MPNFYFNDFKLCNLWIFVQSGQKTFLKTPGMWLKHPDSAV